VAIELNNQGEDPHDLNLLRDGDEGQPLNIPLTGSLQRTTERFTLPAGTYRLWCDLPEHDERGMHATLVVGGG
jgi:plastocyanin